MVNSAFALREGLICPFGYSAYHLDWSRPRFVYFRFAVWEIILAARADPPLPEIMLHISHGLASQHQLHVMPIRAGPQLMLRCIPTVAGKGSQIQSTDESNLAIDHYGLLMMTVCKASGIVQPAVYVTDSLSFDRALHVAPYSLSGLEGSRCSAPQQDAYWDSGRRLGKYGQQA